ncbi:MAG: Fe-S cluster assembly ATPase SufC [Lachnospiraceae bacterium]|nr:Fe-S cluster assembly ATPase SufC [Lachnospiraceae bacterium]
MKDKILEVKNVYANVEDKEILKGLNLSVKKGETHVIMGPNGAGKSTLGNVLMGNPTYDVTKGSVKFMGENITGEDADKIAKLGMFMTFQNPIEVPGITLSNFIRSAYQNKMGGRIRIFEFKKKLKAAMEKLNMDPEYADRDLNVGFSGGEKKKAEILQLLMLKPELAILDETDSGLDVDSVRTVSAGVKAYKEETGGALIIITHSTRILESLDVDYTHILVDGKIVKTSDASLVDEVNRDGFEKYE